MAVHLKSGLIIFVTLIVIMQTTKGQNEPTPPPTPPPPPPPAAESVKRIRRFLQSSAEGTEVGSAVQAKAGLPAIPGLPDAATLMKIAEFLTTVGQQVLPILVSGNSGATDLVTNRISHDMKFLKKFKNELDVLSVELKKNM